MYDLILAFITAFIPCYLLIPQVIHLAKEKHLYDIPDGKRKTHQEITPALGGIAIFAGIVFSVIFWTPFNVLSELQYMLAAFIIIFFIGVKDDILPMSAQKKLIGELLAAGILVMKGNVSINSLYGFFGLQEIPITISVPLTIFTIIVIINAFNLIDGINGLSGSISLIISVVLGIWCFLMDKTSFAILAFAMAGAVTAFLKYNITPAKIFMGDTGALLLGLITSILVIKFMEINRLDPNNVYACKAAPAIAVSIIIFPLFDTARVFAMRIWRGRSPFSADRLHIHHLLIDYGFTHSQATSILVIATMIFMTLAFWLQKIGTFQLLSVILIAAFLSSLCLQKIVERKKQRLLALNGEK
jgi:UDP-GlcNAc:undecaprenyl-phosphate/decaprenyl-phosphate GlcNAc-1-phosphate transferase